MSSRTTAHSVKASRPLRVVAHVPPRAGRASIGATIARVAASPGARTAYVVIGTVGLAALTVAILGPRRLNQQVLKPIRGAVAPQAEKLWDESKPLRDQIARLFNRATTGSGREKLVHDFQSWAGHFRAS